MQGFPERSPSFSRHLSQRVRTATSVEGAFGRNDTLLTWREGSTRRKERTLPSSFWLRKTGNRRDIFGPDHGPRYSHLPVSLLPSTRIIGGLNWKGTGEGWTTTKTMELCLTKSSNSQQTVTLLEPSVTLIVWRDTVGVYYCGSVRLTWIISKPVSTDNERSRTVDYHTSDWKNNIK